MASDGVKVYADFYPSGSNSQPYTLLFHQAGSNRAKYAPIVPRLVKLGFNSLAIDQRSGGDLWGHQKETVNGIGHNGKCSDAPKDLEATLAWAKSSGNNGKVLVWGSSYSPALVFLLAAEHQQVLAFSPAEYLEAPDAVHDTAAKVSGPIFVTSARDRNEIAATNPSSPWHPPSKRLSLFRTLRRARLFDVAQGQNRAGESENWREVKEFLGNSKHKD